MRIMSGFMDTHAHLAMKAFDRDRKDVILRARKAGVSPMIAIGSGDRFEENAETLELARVHPDIFAVIGSHPHRAEVTIDEELLAIEGMAESPRVVALGETGLDYHYNNSPGEVQRERFRDFLSMARQQKKPLVVHSREAESDTLSILREEGARDAGGVIHCFTGSYAFARDCLDLGFYLSFTGVITFKRSEALRDVVRRIPPDRILIETDAPYLAPVPFRGRRNEPAHVVAVGEALAGLKGLSVEDAANITTVNANRCFRIDTD